MSSIPRLSGIKPPSVATSRSRSQATRPRSSANFPSASAGLGKRSSSVGGRSRSNSTGRSLGVLSALPRLSIAARLSSGARSGRKDNRVLHTKEYQKECADKLKEFLLRQHYDKNVQPVTSKLLHGPSNNEYYSLFEFVYKLLSPNYQLNRTNALDEIPLIIRYLHFPHNINRSHVMNPGSRQSWCHLLSFFSWMVDVIQYAKKYEIPRRKDDFEKYASQGVEEEFNNVSLLEYFYEYANDTFREKTSGVTRSDQEHRDILRNQVEEYMGLTQAEMDNLRHQEMEYEDELKQTEVSLAHIQKVEDCIKAFDRDLLEFATFNERISHNIEYKETDLEDARQRNTQLREKIAAKKLKIEAMKEKVKEQSSQGLNAKVLGEKKRRLRMEIADWEKKLEAKNENKWEWEMKQLATHAQFREICSILEDKRSELVQHLKSHAELYETFPEKNKLDKFLCFNEFLGDNVNSVEVINTLNQLPNLFSALKDHLYQEGSWKLEEAIRTEDKITYDLESQATLILLEIKDLEDCIAVNKQHYSKANEQICQQLEDVQERIKNVRAEILALSKTNQKLPELEETNRKLEEKLEKIKISNIERERHYVEESKDLLRKKEKLNAEIDLDNEKMCLELSSMSEAFMKIANE